MRRLVAEMISVSYPSLASASLVEQVVETIAIRSAILSEPSEPLRVDGRSAGNIVVFKNGTLDIEEFIDEQLREPQLLSSHS